GTNGGHQRVEGDAANSPATKKAAEEQRTATATRKKRRRRSVEYVFEEEDYPIIDYELVFHAAKSTMTR
ncbi:hypothetical protein, partial [Klebsiella pneumoniae]|uniref:hypothetical protein n=1 Tax=Klebsiella pneumoniae TaxID=573 RepID=UPI003B5B3BB6